MVDNEIALLTSPERIPQSCRQLEVLVVLEDLFRWPATTNAAELAELGVITRPVKCQRTRLKAGVSNWREAQAKPSGIQRTRALKRQVTRTLAQSKNYS